MKQGNKSAGDQPGAQTSSAQANPMDGKEPTEMHSSSCAADDTSSVVLDERIQAQIGQQLSTFYKELVNQPIPQNFMDLLARLDRQEEGK